MRLKTESGYPGWLDCRIIYQRILGSITFWTSPCWAPKKARKAKRKLTPMATSGVPPELVRPIVSRTYRISLFFDKAKSVREDTYNAVLLFKLSVLFIRSIGQTEVQHQELLYLVSIKNAKRKTYSYNKR